VTHYCERECLLNQRFHKTGRAVCQVFTALKEAVLKARMRKKELVWWTVTVKCTCMYEI